MKRDINGPIDMQLAMEAFEAVFGGKHQRNMSSRKNAVVEMAIRHPEYSDSQLAEATRCSIKTVRKWRPQARLYYLFIRTESGASFSVRLKSSKALPDRCCA